MEGPILMQYSTEENICFFTLLHNIPVQFREDRLLCIHCFFILKDINNLVTRLIQLIVPIAKCWKRKPSFCRYGIDVKLMATRASARTGL